MKRLIFSADETTLAGSSPDQPWRQYRPGEAINALSGQLAVIAVEPFDVDQFPNLNAYFSYSSISTDEDYDTLYSVEAEGSYNTGSIKFSGSSSFMNKVSYSSTSMTIVVSYEVVSNGYGNPTKAIELNANAKDHLKTDPTTFRDTYGDYFVSTWTVGARFLATYTCQTTDTKSLTDFKASISGQSDVLSASGAAEFQASAASHNVSLSCHYSMEGINKLEPNFELTPGGLVNALDWFKQTDEDGQSVNLKYVPRRAMFTHYSQLSRDISNTLQVDPVRFGEIQVLQYKIGKINMILDTLPNYYSDQKLPNSEETVKSTLIELEETFEGSQATLPSNPGEIASLSETANLLLTVLAPSTAVFAFYNSITKTIYDDASKGSWTNTFGITDQVINIPVPIENASQNYAIGWKIGWREYDFQWPWPGYDEDQIVTGWRIINNWDSDTNGEWTSEKLIGKSRGKVHIKSWYDRGLNWTLEVYFVRKQHFPWL